MLQTCTYTVISSMQEVKEFFRAVLLSAGPGADAGLTQLQTLLRVHTVCSLLTLDPYRVNGILRNSEQMNPYLCSTTPPLQL